MKKITSLVLLILIVNVLSIKQIEIWGFSEKHVIVFDTNFQSDNKFEKVYFSDYIFVGRIIEVFDAEFNSFYDYPTTKIKVSIIEELKGTLYKSIIEIEAYGGILNNVLYTVDGKTYKPNELFFDIDDYFLFFLFNNEETNTVCTEIKATEFAINLDTSFQNYNESFDYLYYLNLIENGFIIYDDIVIDSGDGGSGGNNPPVNDGSSMEKAIRLIAGTELIMGLETTKVVYYKIDSETYREINLGFDYSSISLRVSVLDHVGALAYSEVIPAYFGNFNTHVFGDTMYVEIQNIDYHSGSFHIVYNENTNKGYCQNNPNDLQFWYDSIRGGKIDWRSNSIYTSEIEYAFEQWNNVSRINFFEVEWGQDLLITDYTEYGGTALAYYNTVTNTIKLNTAYFIDMSLEERYKTIMHEIGHAIGLDHMSAMANPKISESESLANVMLSGKRKLSNLGPCDIYVDYHRNK
ncbi:MAG: hypothetical protein WC225_00160 [Acholeplasmataceae bacterium]|nr:hypothetical protein [Acholeplasmataceae bacterium]